MSSGRHSLAPRALATVLLCAVCPALLAHMGPVNLDLFGGWLRPMSLSFDVVDGQHVACTLVLNRSGLGLFFAREAGSARKAADKMWALEFFRRSLAVRANGLPCPVEWVDDSCDIVQEELTQEELEEMGVYEDGEPAQTRISQVTYTVNVRYALPEQTIKLEIEWLDTSVAARLSRHFENLRLTIEDADRDAEEYGAFSTSGDMSAEDLARFAGLAAELSEAPRVLAMLTRGLKTQNLYFSEGAWRHTWIEPPALVAVVAQGVWELDPDKPSIDAVHGPRLTASSALFALLALVAACWPGLGNRVRWPAFMLMLLLALTGARYGKAVLWCPQADTGTQGRAALSALADSEKLDVFRRLHRNIYSSFNFDTEDDIYTALEQSVAGQFLERVYADVYTTMTLRENGQAAVFAVDDIAAVECRLLPDDSKNAPPGAFGVFYRWIVDGRIGHWGHVHRRKNEYAAEYLLAPVEGFWKIVDTRLLSQERLEDSQSNGSN